MNCSCIISEKEKELIEFPSQRLASGLAAVALPGRSVPTAPLLSCAYPVHLFPLPPPDQSLSLCRDRAEHLPGSLLQQQLEPPTQGLRPTAPTSCQCVSILGPSGLSFSRELPTDTPAGLGWTQLRHRSMVATFTHLEGQSLWPWQRPVAFLILILL